MEKTFSEICAAVLSHPDYSFETDFLLCGSSHDFTKYQQQKVMKSIDSGVNPQKNWTCKQAKSLMQECLQSIETGRISEPCNTRSLSKRFSTLPESTLKQS